MTAAQPCSQVPCVPVNASKSTTPFFSSVRIDSYQPQYRQAFYDINADWIRQYFVMEEVDETVLSDPEKYIIQAGGEVYYAIGTQENGQDTVLGCCALMPHKDSVGRQIYELTKMGVRPEAQGYQVGSRLGQAVIDKAREMGLPEIMLYTNSALKPAIHVYEKLGFKHVAITEPTGYDRSDVKMVMPL